MEFRVLGIGYTSEEQQIEKRKWAEERIFFEFADTVPQAVSFLQVTTYQCIVVCADRIPQVELELLQRMYQIPIIIMPMAYTAEQRQAYAVFGVMQYAHATGFKEHDVHEAERLQRYFEQERPSPRPMTIVSVKDLSFCLEYRSVEIRGKEVELTEKEFDILSLLIMNQRKVFTHEMIMDAVWHEDISFYSPKAITTHISNLRRKLKTAPDIPEYIKSVRGVGYKFEAPL